MNTGKDGQMDQFGVVIKYPVKDLPLILSWAWDREAGDEFERERVPLTEEIKAAIAKDFFHLEIDEHQAILTVYAGIGEFIYGCEDNFTGPPHPITGRPGDRIFRAAFDGFDGRRVPATKYVCMCEANDNDSDGFLLIRHNALTNAEVVQTELKTVVTITY